MAAMQRVADAVRVRPVEPGDMPFVLDGWIRSWRTSPWAGCVPNNRIWEVTRACIADLVTRGAEILVAEVGGRLVGFVCHEAPDLLHYVFVKRTGFRGLGIGRRLVQESVVALALNHAGRFTHRTRSSTWLMNDGWVWDPVPVRTERV